MISTKNTVALSAAARSHATAATAPARMPPRSAPSTVLAARSLRLSVGPVTSRSAAVVLIPPRYRAADANSPMASPRKNKGAWPLYLGRDGHPLLLAHEELLGRGFAGQQREAEAHDRGQPVAERELR